MGITDAIRVAAEALIANKMRALLTTLGMIIGVGSVIALIAVGQGSQQTVTNSIAGLGSNLIFIRPGSAIVGGVRGGSGTAPTLSQEDSAAIAQEVDGIAAAVPQVNAAAQLIINGQNTYARIAGVPPSYGDLMDLRLADGSFIGDQDMQGTGRVAVLGAQLAATLFPDGSEPVGQNLRISAGRNNMITLQVEGVLQPSGGDAQNSNDDQLFVPLSFVEHQIAGLRGAQNTSPVSQITVQVTDKSQMDAAKQEITDLLLQRHAVVDADFTVESQSDLEATASEASRSMTVLLGAIAGISLVVGGIGIMNIMLVSVTERTREIGLRKAVGASPSDIMLQFLTEAMVVTVLGGLLGVAAGVGAAYFMNGRDIAGLGSNIQTVVSWTSVAAACAVTVLIGVFFGLYPAERAANLRPIDALHYE